MQVPIVLVHMVQKKTMWTLQLFLVKINNANIPKFSRLSPRITVLSMQKCPSNEQQQGRLAS